MDERNYTVVTEFILVGFTDYPELQIPLFILFLGIYTVTLVGNLGLIALIWIDAQLQTPMYFFLGNLSLIDVGYSTIITPKLLMLFVSENRTISFMDCAVQFYFFIAFVTSDCCLLSVMAYDRFVAIGNPLLYSTAMSKRFCIVLVMISYITSFVNATVQTSSLFTLSFCGSNVINHFFCDLPAIIILSCSDTHNAAIIHFAFAMVISMFTLLVILVSYVYIGTALLKVGSGEGRHKAISTCASHLTAVTIFYGTLSFTCLRLTSGSITIKDKVICVFYTLIIPMLNPLIYSLRNKDVKDALQKSCQKLFYR